MIRTKKIQLALLIVFIAIQFIQPDRNTGKKLLPADFANVYAVPNRVQSILQNTCYDCHSNSSNYPWYSNIQPVGWIMARHIKNGKEHLNFSEFGNYRNRRRITKLKEISNQIRDDEMPISSYKMMHKNARLSQSEKDLLMNWMNKTADSLSANN